MESDFKGYSLAQNGNDFISLHFQVKEFKREGHTDVVVSTDLILKLERLSDCVNNKAIYIVKTYSPSRVAVRANGYTADDLAIYAQACGFEYINILNKNVLDLSVDPSLGSDNDYISDCGRIDDGTGRHAGGRVPA